MDGEDVAKVTLTEVRDGYFIGKWDWFMLDGGELDTWPPPANREYVAYLDESTSPCQGEFEPITFRVLAGEPNYSDETAPESVSLTVRGADGATETVSEGISDLPIEVMPLENAEVTVSGRDPDGLQQVAIEQGTSHVGSPTSVSSDPNVVPIPDVIEFATSFDGPEPYVSFDLSARAVNYSQTGADRTDTATLKVIGKHPKPTITGGIDSSTAIYSDQLLDIDGNHFKYSTVSTGVYFQKPSGTPELSPGFTVVDRDNIDNVQVPQSLQGYFGPVDVWVETSENGGAGLEKSDPVTIQILDRNETFEFFDEDNEDPEQNFTESETTFDCSGSGQEAVRSISVTDFGGSGNLNDYRVQFSSTSNSVDFDFQTYDANGLEMGGFVVSSNCRTAAVLSRSSLNSGLTEPRFFIKFVHFASDGQIYQTDHDPVDLYRKTDDPTDPTGHIFEPVPRAFEVAINGDGTIVSIGDPNPSLQTARDRIAVSGWVFDLLRQNEVGDDFALLYSNDLAEWDTSLSGRNVKLEIDGGTVVDEPLQ